MTKQHLTPRFLKKPSAENILELFRDIGCVQIDPISAVAQSHLIVLWSRLGNFDRADLDRLLWRDKKLFEYWAHQYSIVLMEDYPLYHTLMRSYPASFAKGWGPAWTERVQRWLKEHSQLEDYVLHELKEKGPLLSRQFEDESRVRPHGPSWGSWGNVSRMLFHLFFKGKVMIVGRQANQKLWDLSERFLPSNASKKDLTMDQVEHEAVQRSIRALGIASASQIDYHFLRGRYRNLKETLKRLTEESKILPVTIQHALFGKNEHYIHEKDIPLLEQIESDDWQPRVTLLSPFDNLICDRKRTKLLFNFDYSIEIYTPSHKRKYGYYVLPILYGDRFIGRIDPLMDRKNQKLHIKAVHAESKAPKDKAVAEAVAETISDFSQFLGAKDVVYSKRVPTFWKTAVQ